MIMTQGMMGMNNMQHNGMSDGMNGMNNGMQVTTINMAKIGICQQRNYMKDQNKRKRQT